MLEKFYITDKKHTDLNMHRCGIEDCSPGYAWGPAVRDHYIIHYVLAGKGLYQVNGKTYNLGKGDGFLICPNTVIYYEADTADPWSYSWVGFNGLKAETYLKQANLSLENPIFRYDKDSSLKDCLNSMIASRNLEKGREIKLLGLLHLFIYHLVEASGSFDAGGESSMDVYIRKAVEYIASNYHSRLTVNGLASHIGLDRSYLYSLFKKHLNSSPQEYLISFRMDKACELLKNPGLTIGDVARSVGYEDQLLFSKVFKKAVGESPRDYRRK